MDLLYETRPYFPNSYQQSKKSCWILHGILFFCFRQSGCSFVQGLLDKIQSRACELINSLIIVTKNPHCIYLEILLVLVVSKGARSGSQTWNSLPQSCLPDHCNFQRFRRDTLIYCLLRAYAILVHWEVVPRQLHQSQH